ncbi:DUF1758 domain-containing protein [Trichonephila clavipes]|nr:DUF1758 domain-containing protein [Trichonephila clavipes]
MYQYCRSLTPPIVPPTIVNTTNLPSSTIDTLTPEPRSSIKLSKLTVNKYYDDHKNWLEFLSQFENAIDKISSLSKIEKLIYLKSLIGGVAAKAISGFALTESNYDAALELLKTRFGQKNRLINAHLRSLLNITPIKNTGDTNSLRKLYDWAETEIRNLESLGIKIRNRTVKKFRVSREPNLPIRQCEKNKIRITQNKSAIVSLSAQGLITEMLMLNRKAISQLLIVNVYFEAKTCMIHLHAIRFYQNNSDKTTFRSHKKESDDSITSVSSCQTETKSQRVLLQTASVVARYNKQFRNCPLLTDTAEQRSFVERKFSRLLKLPDIRKEKLSIYSFGDKSPVEKTLNAVKIRLENKDDPNSLEIEALETEKNIRCTYSPA